MNKLAWSPTWHPKDVVAWSTGFCINPISQSGGSNTKVGDHDTSECHNLYFIITHCLERLACIGWYKVALG